MNRTDSNYQHKRAKKVLKLLITGGHITPAIAVIEMLHLRPDIKIFVIGRKHLQEENQLPSLETDEIAKYHAEFIPISTAKFPHYFDRRSFIMLFKIPLGIFSALWHVARIKPDIILTFGGYVAVPVAIAGKLLGIPIITHEQTPVKGLANSFIETIAHKIAVSWKTSLRQFRNQKKVVYTGNPVRQIILKGPGKTLPFMADATPLIYITGGNQGSHYINLITAGCLAELLSKYKVAHQCGIGKAGEDISMLLESIKSLSSRERNRYIVRKWFSDKEVAWILRNADLVISRAGANIITELALIGVKSLLIPLPISRKQEQFENALILKNAGIAKIIFQNQLSAPLLVKKISEMQNNHKFYASHFLQTRKQVNPKATEELIKLIYSVYEKTKKQ